MDCLLDMKEHLPAQPGTDEQPYNDLELIGTNNQYESLDENRETSLSNVYRNAAVTSGDEYQNTTTNDNT